MTILALLGPTNTGKTHRAIERMLEHETGMLGLPLRLLAREVYDRVVRRVGEDVVALVTGEEKRIPRGARYWVCTVEAMPTEREVEFLGVDEIQLAAHEQRGHVFTDRLLRARGTKETWFLGSKTMDDAIAELVPTAKRTEHPRLSKLSFAGSSSMNRLLGRSAVVAFSMSQVYELAEKARVHRGGAAVVLGSLSPRARNAQVAMFQAGDVDTLVATDAIGMGLNLDVRHVAFAGFRKFDGRDVRELDPQEIAQIAGRAGRYVQDGTFGTLAPLEMSPEAAWAIERHELPLARKLKWRNPDLDFSSLAGLSESLRLPPRSRWLAPMQRADDVEAFEMLRVRPGVKARADAPERVRLLWEVASIPDFERLLFESYVSFLEAAFLELTGPRARLSSEWIAPRVLALDDTEGDADVLVSRLAAVRTWTYVASSRLAVEEAAHWEERTRAIEDRLSDALHQTLVRRFVDEAPKKKAPARPHARVVPVSSSNLTIDASHPFAKLAALRTRLVGTHEKPQVVEHDDVVSAPIDAFVVDDRDRIAFGARIVGRLVRGARAIQPHGQLTMGELGAERRRLLAAKVMEVARTHSERVFAPIRELGLSEDDPTERGLRYALEEGLGRMPRAEADVPLALLGDDRVAALKTKGLRMSKRHVWVTGISLDEVRRYRRIVSR